jgi:hypothetical protein
MIKLEGLTRLQQDLCDQIWNMESHEQLVSWFDMLPKSLAHEAYVMIQMIYLAALDDEPIEDFSAAQQVVNAIKSRL